MQKNNIPLSLKHLMGWTLSLILMAYSLNIAADESQQTARKLRLSGQILPLETIYEKAKKIKNGKILESELEKKHHLYLYEIELLDPYGQVWEMEFDAKSGELIKLEED